MVKLMYVLSAVFVAFFALLIARPGSSAAYTEKDMERLYPSSLGAYHMRPDQTHNNPNQTYRMDESTYQSLVPYGIVCRVLDNGKTAYDVVVISGDQPDTFHNPLVCFVAQDYKVVDSKQIVLHTKSRGDVPCIEATATKGGHSQIAIYTYEGPSGMFPENTPLHRDMFATQLETGKPQSASFFRFMTEYSTTTAPELEAFAVSYLDASPVRPKVGQF
jgi:hypothetical protein